MGRHALLKVVRLAAIASGLGMMIFLVSWPVADVLFRLTQGKDSPWRESVQGSLPDAGFIALANGVLGQAVFAFGAGLGITRGRYEKPTWPRSSTLPGTCC